MLRKIKRCRGVYTIIVISLLAAKLMTVRLYSDCSIRVYQSLHSMQQLFPCIVLAGLIKY